ncbi:F-box protein At5g07610-like [Rutidosis leptorrhynchoides]|uniref:F-box protein At5g07610-like n=1 Tax=Rutidosis leptorrhynchoides TaxID=125765 RepID=UPI003A99A5B0
MGLAYNTIESPHYKVVCIYQNFDRSRLNVQIYSSDTKRWKILDDTLDLSNNHVPFLTRGVYMNGGMYWSPINNPIDSWYCFKLDIEKFKKLELPSSMKKACSTSVRYFGESCGYLHLAEMDRLKGCLYVYEMMHDCSDWVVKYEVEIVKLMVEFHKSVWCNWCIGRLEILDIVRGEEQEEENTFMVLKCCREIIGVNLLDKSFNKLFDIVTRDTYGRTMESHRYVAI